MPARMAVIVCEVREFGHIWPIVRIDQRSDEHLQITSGADAAPKGLRILQQATDLVLQHTSQIAARQIAEKIASGKATLPAPMPETAGPSANTSGDVPPDHSGPADPTFTTSTP